MDDETESEQLRQFIIETVLQRLFYILVLPPFESVEEARATIKGEIEQDPSLKDHIDPLIDRIEV